MVKEENTMLGGTAIRPVERHGLEAVSWFLYDRKTGAIMGRTPKSWFLITIFYMIYYSCLAGFWGLCMYIFMHTTITSDQPRWLTRDSIIGESPALGVRPSQTDALLDSGIFMFNKDAMHDVPGEIPGWKGWADRTQAFLDTFPKDKAACKQKFCDNGIALDEDEFCDNGKFCKNGIALDKDGVPTEKINQEERNEKFYFFDQTSLGTNCTKENNFGFSSGKPCVILKLNKIYGLEHDYYNEANVDMPNALQMHITSNGEQYRDHVWVDCHGENAFDKDVLKSKVTYSPASRGFSSIFYPYMNAQGYQSPLLAVQFEDLPVGQLMHIECRAYAGNINYDRKDKIGKAHFEIMMHDSNTAGCANGGC